MKSIKRSIIYFFIFLTIILALLLLRHPYLVRVLYYRTPDANTYMAFPQTIVNPAKRPFHFFRLKQKRVDLDTLHVYNGSHQFIPFNRYFEEGRLNAFLVIRNDTILYEKYSKGYSDSTLTTVFSGAKSMISIMIGQAIDEGKIRKTSDLVISYIPELRSNKVFDEITIQNLLDMKSGLHFDDALAGVVKAFLSDEAKYYYTHDMKAELRHLRSDYPPGRVWQYKSVDAILLAWVLEQATGTTVSQYFQKHLWNQIGAQYPASFGLDHRDGLANTASRFQVTAVDWAKIGRLYLKKGSFDGKQLVSENWVNQSTALQGKVASTAKGWQKSTQCNLWWVPQQGQNGDYAAEGMLGQRLYVDPKTNTIIVQFAQKGSGDYPYRKISRCLAGLPFSYPN